MIKSKQIQGLGSSAFLNTGTGADNIVILDSQGRLPAVDASNIENAGGSSGGTTIRPIHEVSISANYQIADSYAVGALVSITNTSSTIRDVYLPSTQSSNIGAGYYFFVGNYSASSYRIFLKPHPSTSDTLSTHLTTITLNRDDCVKAVSDGAGNWIFVQRGQS